MNMRSILGALVFLSALVVVGAKAEAEQVYAVVGEGISDSELSVSSLRSVYMGKTTYWKSGKRCFPLMRAQKSKPAKAIFKGVLKTVPTRFRHHWTQLRLSGKGQPPREVSEGTTVAKMVKSRAGAIGFIVESEKAAIASLGVKLVPVGK